MDARSDGMTDHWTDRLSEYLDGDLPAGARGALETHLETCIACRTTLAELRRVVARAQALEDTPPARDLWPAIAGRLTPLTGGVVDLATRRGPRAAPARRVSLTWLQLAAAALVLIAASAGTVMTVLRSHGPAAAPAPAPVALAPAPDGVVVAGWAGVARYDAAVAELEQMLAQHRAQLDTATVRVVQKNLDIIDRAIADARAALAADPSSAYLNHHLARTMRRKLDLLRRANALVAEPT